MSCKHTSRWSPKQRLQLRFIFLGSCNNFIALQTSVTFFIAAISCDNCNFCHNRYSCHSHSSQKCELCTECGTSKMISGLVKHWMCLTCPPIDNSVQLNDRKRRLFYHLGSMVFCNKWLYHLDHEHSITYSSYAAGILLKIGFIGYFYQMAKELQNKLWILQ